MGAGFAVAVPEAACGAVAASFAPAPVYPDRARGFAPCERFGETGFEGRAVPWLVSDGEVVDAVFVRRRARPVRRHFHDVAFAGFEPVGAARIGKMDAFVFYGGFERRRVEEAGREAGDAGFRASVRMRGSASGSSRPDRRGS